MVGGQKGLTTVIEELVDVFIFTFGGITSKDTTGVHARVIVAFVALHGGQVCEVTSFVLLVVRIVFGVHTVFKFNYNLLAD